LLGDQIGPAREHTFTSYTGRGNGKIVPCDARQTQILTTVILPPRQNTNMWVDHERRQISFHLAPICEASSLETRSEICIIQEFTYNLTADLTELRRRCSILSHGPHQSAFGMRDHLGPSAIFGVQSTLDIVT